jgi:hypothetical protein
MSGINLEVAPEVLKPLIAQIVSEVVGQLEAERSKLDGKLAYSEQEAASLLGLREHQLRDERLRSRIRASAIVGRRIRYLRQDLLAYLLERRWEPNGRH